MAIALALVAFALFAVGDASSKIFIAESNAAMALWGRSAVFAVLILPLLHPRRWQQVLTRPPAKLLLLRSVFPFLGGTSVLASLAFLPLAQVTSILFLAPLLSMAFGRIILGEPVNLWGWFAVVLGFAGVLVIMRPISGEFTWALLLPAFGSVFTALGQIMTRVVAQRTTPKAVLFFMAVVSLGLSSLPLPLVWQTPTLPQWASLGVTGICQAVGQFCMIGAYARATASRIAPFSYAQLLTATVLGLVLFSEVPDMWTVIGALLIVAGGLISLHWAQPAQAAPARRTKGGS